MCDILELNKPYWVVEVDNEQVHVEYKVLFALDHDAVEYDVFAKHRE